MHTGILDINTNTPTNDARYTDGAQLGRQHGCSGPFSVTCDAAAPCWKRQVGVKHLFTSVTWLPTSRKHTHALQGDTGVHFLCSGDRNVRKDQVSHN